TNTRIEPGGFRIQLRFRLLSPAASRRLSLRAGEAPGATCVPRGSLAFDGHLFASHGCLLPSAQASSRRPREEQPPPLARRPSAAPSSPPQIRAHLRRAASSSTSSVAHLPPGSALPSPFLPSVCSLPCSPQPQNSSSEWLRLPFASHERQRRAVDSGFSDHTYDFLASCAVVVSSLLPPFAKTIKKSTGY
ncbi:unnamed protein product, partial [Urochloa humidicola]